MKLKVIGWTEYDNTSLEAGYCGWAALNAITDEIIEKGYSFSGEDHQEMPRCAPVMNDGKIRRMSQRGWGRLMADAYGYNGIYDYSLFAFGMTDCTYPPPSEEYDTNAVKELLDMLKPGNLLLDVSRMRELMEKVSPDSFVYKNALTIIEQAEMLEDIIDDGEESADAVNAASDSSCGKITILTDDELRERITVKDATAAELASLLKKGKFVRRDEPIFRYIDRGDILTLVVDGEEFSFKVTEVNREKDFTKEEDDLIWQSRYSFNEELSKKANKLFSETPQRVIINAEFSKTDGFDEEKSEDESDALKKLLSDIRSRNEAADDESNGGDDKEDASLDSEDGESTDTEESSSISGMWSEKDLAEIFKEFMPDFEVDDEVDEDDGESLTAARAISPDELLATLEALEDEDEPSAETLLDKDDPAEAELSAMLDSISEDSFSENPPSDAECGEVIGEENGDAASESASARLLRRLFETDPNDDENSDA